MLLSAVQGSGWNGTLRLVGVGATGTATGTSISPANHADTGVGHLLVAIVVLDDNNVSFAASAGWTTDHLFQTTQGSDRTMGFYSRIADGTSSDDVTFSWSFSASAVSVVFTFVNAASPHAGDTYIEKPGGPAAVDVPSNDGTLTASDGDIAIFAGLAQVSEYTEFDATPAGVTSVLLDQAMDSETFSLGYEVLTGNPGQATWSTTGAGQSAFGGTYVVRKS